MRSYIKIHGPPLLKAIRALETLALDATEVCIRNTFINVSMPQLNEPIAIHDYFNALGDISEERCDTIISKSGESLGEYDFFFEWFVDPTVDQLHEIIEKIDDALAEIGVRYTITTK